MIAAFNPKLKTLPISLGFKKTLYYWETVNKYILYALLFGVTMLSAPVTLELGYVAGVMTLALTLSLVFKSNDGFFENLLLCCAISLLLFSNNQQSIFIELMQQKFNLQKLYNIIFIGLFISSVGIFIAGLRKRYLLITPSDFLILIIPVTLLLLPNTFYGGYFIPSLCIKSLIVFLALRTLIRRRQENLRRISLLTCASLALIFLKSVLFLRFIY